MDGYLNGSVFLPFMNDLKNASPMDKTRFTSLNGLLLVMFSEDTMIHPKETAHFASLDKDGNLVSMKD